MSKRYTSRNSLRILFEDDHFIAVFKPAGLLTISAAGRQEKTLEDIANEEYRVGKDPQCERLHICHRLDRETSGVIVLAKGKRNQQALMDLFHKREVHKKYIVFVYGTLRQPKGEIRIPVKDTYESKFSPHAPAKDALTRYSLVEQRKGFAIVEAEPVTGRTNQLRIHFKEIGHPIVGESKYIFRKDFDIKFKRTALHAAEISFVHPAIKELVTIRSSLAVDMQRFLEKWPT